MLFARGLAFVQMIVAVIGMVTLHLMVKIDDPERHPDAIANMATWLAHHGLWLFAVPILYAVFGAATRGKITEKTLNTIGVIVTALLVLLLVIPLAFYLR